MRLVLLPMLATVAALPATAPGPQSSVATPERTTCVDKLSQVRDAAGQPRLDRSPALPGEGYLIAAVDKRIDGCAVLQMHRNIDDLRPVPQPTMGPARLIPIR